MSSESPEGSHQDTDPLGSPEPPPDQAGPGTAGSDGKHPAGYPQTLRL